MEEGGMEEGEVPSIRLLLSFFSLGLGIGLGLEEEGGGRGGVSLICISTLLLDLGGKAGTLLCSIGLPGTGDIPTKPVKPVLLVLVTGTKP